MSIDYIYCRLFAQPVTLQTRETIARLRNCIVALARQKVMLFDTTIVYTYDESLKYQVSDALLLVRQVELLLQVKELLATDIMEEITVRAKQVELD